MSELHTPGPWIAKEGGRFDPEINITTEFRCETNKVRICGIDIAFTGEFGLEQKANACLIAAAPDLLDACIKTVEENGHLADGDNCTLIHLVRAIAKATRGEV